MRAACILVPAAILGFCATAEAGRPWQPRASRPARESAPRPPEPPAVERSADFKKALQQGLRLLERGRYPQATEKLGRAVDLCPACAEARLARARALLTVGYLGWEPEAVRRALADARVARDLEPGSAEARLMLHLVGELWRRMHRAKPGPPPPGPVGDGQPSRPAQAVR